MTHYEKIRQLSIEQMAVFITEVLYQEDCKIAKILCDRGIKTSVVSLDRTIQKEIHKQWLESEAEE